MYNQGLRQSKAEIKVSLGLKVQMNSQKQCFAGKEALEERLGFGGKNVWRVEVGSKRWGSFASTHVNYILSTSIYYITLYILCKYKARVQHFR